ncbi:ABC transporter ATP-binding protein [Dokdonia sp. Hel_I_53]|uniref:ABC transporter ATP-binding protein n=1 Tax=Dokdonia sp. Hel_I_53 TaxID=1566287 RepID=UPI00119C5125|nr:ABC transporter ATP-binding protein [Dokdonia sp. Hel_I_53]TVZ52569.1 peptide/nickel transport system ATP-binding protein [Dokdonia sp. Hel_I_53]
MAQTPLLLVEGLSQYFYSQGKDNQVLFDISFKLLPNEILGIVGESGSGKSLTSLAIMGLLPKINSKTLGSIKYEGEELQNISEKSWQSIRGNKISMIFQEPMSSLNPSMKCGEQVLEILLEHFTLSRKRSKQQVLELFEKVKLPSPDIIYNAYPHEISGGQKQRVMIAMAIACKPKILIADEPTTALDVTVQQEIILLLKELQQETGMSIVFISHDLSLVSEIADRVIVMYRGKIVETATSKELFKSPKHQYTKALLNARPSLEQRLKKLPTIKDYLENKPSSPIETKQEREKHQEDLYAQQPLLEINNIEKTYFSKTGFFGKQTEFKAVNDVSFSIYEGETLGLVGESGCGKSTLGNAILQLDKATAGSIFYKGKDITALKGSELRSLRKEIQIIFQDPFASLNPRLTVGQAIIEPMQVHTLYGSNKDRKEKVFELLERVGLDHSAYNRYPHEFSGGQRQRVGIARTIAVKPKLIVCDESVSALDISVQAQVLNLLNELKSDFGFTYIFISHDLAVVKYMSDQLVVMNKGKIEEIGDADKIYAAPEKEYTQKLIDAIPKGI